MAENSVPSQTGVPAGPPPLPPPERATDADVVAARDDARAQAEVVRQRLADAQHATQDRAAELGAQARAKYLERPELFVAGAFAAGLVLARLLKGLGRG